MKSEIKYAFLMCVNRDTGFLRDAIDSVLSQTYRNFNFYIIANNCDDDLWNYLLGFNDDRIILKRTVIGQLCFNLNYGLNIIEDDYILRMDADDIALPDRLAKVNRIISENRDIDVLSGNAVVIDTSGNEIGRLGENKKPLWLGNSIIHPTVAVKREVLIANKGYSWGFASEDYDLWIRLKERNYYFYHLQDDLVRYRISDGQSKGGIIPYSESAALLLREFLKTYKFKYLFGTFLAVMKRFLKATK